MSTKQQETIEKMEQWVSQLETYKTDLKYAHVIVDIEDAIDDSQRITQMLRTTSDDELAEWILSAECNCGLLTFDSLITGEFTLSPSCE